ncbi:hypothetical protein G653_00405 [Candidatus Liberibacter americanus PW_SP]|nr:hypothetical protein G653_00405 [Candidatus Liberibacter americanus PW_SP]
MNLIDSKAILSPTQKSIKYLYKSQSLKALLTAKIIIDLIECSCLNRVGDKVYIRKVEMFIKDVWG